MRQYGQASCYDPKHWLFGPWNGFEIVLCDFTMYCFQKYLIESCIPFLSFWKPWRRNIRLFVIELILFLCSFYSLIYLNVEYMFVDLITLLLVSSSDSNCALNANGKGLCIRYLIVKSLH